MPPGVSWDLSVLKYPQGMASSKPDSAVHCALAWVTEVTWPPRACLGSDITLPTSPGVPRLHLRNGLHFF